MCGIAGLALRASADAGELNRRVKAMTDAIAHRGPDSDGAWVDADAGLGLGHRRLAIVDLSPTGYQPMASGSGRFVVSYNGEIYNAAELRVELEANGGTFRGTSDTEVMLAGFEAWGIEPTLQRLVGMFGIALWDRAERSLFLVRDRLGIKPVYYGSVAGGIGFGSELKAMLAVCDRRPEVDPNSVAAFMRHGYVPASHSIFEGILKLEAGHVVQIKNGEAKASRPFWSLPDAIRRVRSESGWDQQSPRDYVDALERQLTQAVGQRMVADVPLGAFLSGGIDSSTVVALMQAQSMTPVRTFSIGFQEMGFDEAVHAKTVAAHLGTDHTELYLQPSDAMAVIPRLGFMYDEPFADVSQIPTFLVSELARRSVTVSLSGDGGDELFAGYDRYAFGDMLSRRRRQVPGFARPAAGTVLRTLSEAGWNRLMGLAPRRFQVPRLGEKIHLVAGLLSGSDREIYRRLVSQWTEPGGAVADVDENHAPVWGAPPNAVLSDHMEWMQYADTLTYLPDDILTKVDRASMAVALEARVPILDHRVVELAWQIPTALRVRDGVNKWPLREVLYRYVPKAMFERPKQGFSVPIGAWLRGPLREWAEDLLSTQSLRSAQHLNVDGIRARWSGHLSEERDWEAPLWSVLMYQAWRREWLGG